VLSASRVYRSYNGVFDPKKTEEWPFNQKSRNPSIGIIGSGNVSADLARILLADQSSLEETTINPNFLMSLKDQGPQIVYIFARGGPQDSKISLKELEEIAEAGFWISSWFDLSLIPSKMDEKQRDLLTFYSKFLNNPKPNSGLKRLYFYFQHTPSSFQSSGEDVELRFSNQKNKFRFRNVITALGRKPSSMIGKGTDYVTGWASGRGGNLKSAEESAKLTTATFTKDFKENKFKPTYDVQSPENETWHLKCPVNKQEFLNILTKVQEKKLLIRTANDFQVAKASSSNQNQPNNAKKRKVLDPNLFKEIKQDPENLTIYNGENVFTVPVKTNVNLLKTLKKMQQENSEFTNAIPDYECDGDGTCGTCGFDVIIQGGNEVKQGKKEKQLLEINGYTEKSVLSCQHSCDKMKGYVLYVDKKKAEKKTNETGQQL
jgi:ferredoxin